MTAPTPRPTPPPTPRPAPRPWLAPAARAREAELLASLPADGAAARLRIDAAIRRSREIHEVDCLNLNPATNVMSPRAEAALAAGLGSRPSLGHPGDKYETGLEAMEELEVATMAAACRVFRCAHAEIRVLSGAAANLTAFMALARPGDAVIVPPASIGGHVTHHGAGAAGLLGLEIHEAPIDPERYTVDVDGVRALAERVRPRLITIGSSLNLAHHPVDTLRRLADDVDAHLMFDAAHLCGPIAGGAWPDPLAEGAHLMTMSTYKSLGGPAGGLVCTDDADIAERLDRVAFPGLTANFDTGRTTALGLTLLDWEEHGARYATDMVAAADRLAAGLVARGLPLVTADGRPTVSHQMAIDAADLGGGHEASRRLRAANLLACAIGHPGGDAVRLGTPEMVRWGIGPGHADTVADLVARALHDDPATVAADVTAFRSDFRTIGYCSA